MQALKSLAHNKLAITNGKMLAVTNQDCTNNDRKSQANITATLQKATSSP